MSLAHLLQIGDVLVDRLLEESIGFPWNQVWADAKANVGAAWVIQCNDMVVCVVIGSEEEANARVEAERQVYFDRNPQDWIVFKPKGYNTLQPQERRELQWEDYTARCYWRAHKVPLY